MGAFEELHRQRITGSLAMFDRMIFKGHLTGLYKQDGARCFLWSQGVPLTDFTIGRGVLLPEGFPGEWNYWVRPAAGRGSSGDRPRLDRVERLQLSLRREDGVAVTPGGYGVEVESISLGFGHPPPAASAP